MIVLKARNAHQALPEMMHQVQSNDKAVTRSSRNGPVIQFVEPFTIQYAKPTERVVFWPERDANPFFHLFESLWMLAGRNDVAYPARYSSNIGQFSDDGQTFHGAYGHRWRRHFQLTDEMTGRSQPIDQLSTIAAALKANPEDRRQVLSMWDATVDLGRQGKDLPCNLQIVFQRDHNGRLNMTVYNRSNDILWGALGANCVHMSYLQEYMAAAIGCEVGQYWQISANMHAYTELTPLLKKCLPLDDHCWPSSGYKHTDPYEGAIEPFPLVNTPLAQWEGELRMFIDEPTAIGFRDPFFRRVASPLAAAYVKFSDRSDPHRFEHAFNALNSAANCDWRLAAFEWLTRREAAAKLKSTTAQ
jgi:thymidylate synthase